jgi:hypothetical protein
MEIRLQHFLLVVEMSPIIAPVSAVIKRSYRQQLRLQL